MDKIRDKIRALILKAKSTSHTGEADVYMAKAVELMERHQIALYELGEEDPIGMTEGVTAQAGPPSYKSDVQRHLAFYYGAKPILQQIDSKRWTVHIIGPESSRITTELMTEFVWKQVCDAAKSVALLGLYNRAQAIRHVAKALCLRIQREISKRQPAAATEPGSCFSIVVVDAIEAWQKDHYHNLTISTGHPRSLSVMAQEAASKISLNQQIHRTDCPQLQ